MQIYAVLSSGKFSEIGAAPCANQSSHWTRLYPHVVAVFVSKRCHAADCGGVHYLCIFAILAYTMRSGDDMRRNACETLNIPNLPRVWLQATHVPVAVFGAATDTCNHGYCARNSISTMTAVTSRVGRPSITASVFWSRRFGSVFELRTRHICVSVCRLSSSS